MKWTDENHNAAKEDGWVFSVPFARILAFPFVYPFEEREADKEILEYVKERAREGSELHKKALLLLIKRKVGK